MRMVRALVRDGSRNCMEHPQRCISRELYNRGGIRLIDRHFIKPDIGLLNQGRGLQAALV